MATDDETKATNDPDTPVRKNYVFCPAWTDDYRIIRLKEGDVDMGLVVVANRDIPKGEEVFENSLEFAFSDVREGDDMLFVPNYPEEEEYQPKLQLTQPVGPEELFETHGVQRLIRDYSKDDTPPSELHETWHLESPGMYCNHACEPNMVPDCFDWLTGVGLAARDIRKGEALTCDYTAFDYEEDGKTFTCHCGSKNCRKDRLGFAFLTPEEKENMRNGHALSDVVRARDAHAQGKGPPVVEVDQPLLPRPAVDAMLQVPRLVFPGPGCALDDESRPTIAIRPCYRPTFKEDKLEYGLFALQDFVPGQRVYHFWAQPWPIFPKGENNTHQIIDMVMAMPLLESMDVEEGTTMRIDPRLYASQDAESESNGYHFTGYDLLTHHSCDPNIVYHYEQEEDEDNWRSGYACRNIKKGDQLFVDFNCCMWDRSIAEEELDLQNCLCGSTNCRKIAQGYRHLGPEDREALLALNRQRLPATEKKRGQALAPFIRKQLKLENS